MNKALILCTIAAGLVGVPTLAAMPSGDNQAAHAIASGQWFEAEAMLRQDLAQKPNDPVVLLDLAFVLRNTGRQREAIGVYRHVMRLGDDPVVTVDDGANHTKTLHAKILGRSGMEALEWVNR
jgi:cytochrome c-type biogenesis protein CcmH/NrfG